MRCEDMAELLTELMEGDLEPVVEAEALEHLAGCEHCEGVLAATRDAVRLAHDHGRPDLGDDDRARMFGAIVAEVEPSADP